MKETEITVQVFNELNELKILLKTKGFEIVEEYEIHDYYFSKLPINYLSNLPYPDLIRNSFLVRDIKDSNPKIKIVYKDKILDEFGNVISEEKISCKVDNLENILKILKMVEIECWCELKQKMIIYKKDEVAFAVQIIDGLGIFIEYEEDETMINLSEYEKIKLMLDNLNNIGLKLGDDFSCKKVYMKYLKENK